MFKNLFKKEKIESFKNFVEGNLVYIENVSDEVFSQKMIGDGYAIKPTDSNVYAPMSGKVTSLFPTGHAIGLTLNNGLDIMLHLGIDTVELEGKGFEIMIKEGQVVKQGDILIKADWDYISKSGYDTVSILVLPNGEKIDLRKKEGEHVSSLEENVIEIIK